MQGINNIWIIVMGDKSIEAAFNFLYTDLFYYEWYKIL